MDFIKNTEEQLALEIYQEEDANFMLHLRATTAQWEHGMNANLYYVYVHLLRWGYRVVSIRQDARGHLLDLAGSTNPTFSRNKTIRLTGI